jgi:hypothetical protein
MQLFKCKILEKPKLSQTFTSIAAIIKNSIVIIGVPFTMAFLEEHK